MMLKGPTRRLRLPRLRQMNLDSLEFGVRRGSLQPAAQMNRSACGMNREQETVKQPMKICSNEKAVLHVIP